LPTVFPGGVQLSRLEKARQGNTFAQRRDAAIIAVFRVTGIRLAELIGIFYHPDDPATILPRDAACAIEL
jgi:site-specific recombinase XerD